MNIHNEHINENMVRLNQSRFHYNRLYNKFSKLKPSKDNAQEAIDLGLKIDESPYFHGLYEFPHIDEKFYEKLSVAFKLNKDNEKAAEYSKKAEELHNLDMANNNNKILSLYRELNNIELSEDNAQGAIGLCLMIMNNAGFRHCTENIKNTVYTKLNNANKMIRDKNGFEFLYNRFNNLELSESSAQGAIYLGLAIMDSACFSSCIEDTKRNVYEKLGNAYCKINEYDNAIAYFKLNGKLTQKQIDEITRDKEKFDKYLEEINPAEMTSEKFELLFNRFSELELSEENVDKLISIGLKFTDSAYFRDYAEDIKRNVHEKLGHAYWKINKYDNAIAYFKRNGKSNQKEIDEIRRDKGMIESLYNKLNNLELSENNAWEAIDLGLRFMDTTCFSRCTKNIKDNVHEKLGHAYWKINKYDDAIEYFKRNGKLNQKEIDEIIHDKEMIESLYNKLNNLDLSEENNVQKVIDLSLEFMDSPCFSRCIEDIKRNVYEKLGHAYQMKKEYVDAVVYFKRNGEFNQKEIDEITHDKEKFDKYLEEIDPAEMTSEKFELLFNRFSELELSESNAQKIIDFGLKFMFIQNPVFKNKYEREFGIIYYRLNLIHTQYPEQSTKICENSSKLDSIKKLLEKSENEAKAFLYQSTVMEKSAKVQRLKKLLFNDQPKEFSKLVEILNQVTEAVVHLEEVTKELKGDRVQ